MQPVLSRQREITEVDISRLAREIARDLRPLELTLEKLSIDSEQFERIKQNPIFQARMSEEASMWAASTKANLRDRVSIKAAAAVEELLIEAVAIVQNPDIPGAARVQGLQFLAKLGQLGEGGGPTDDGSGRVTINILIGGKKLQFDKETEPKTIDGQAIDISEQPQP